MTNREYINVLVSLRKVAYEAFKSADSIGNGDIAWVSFKAIRDAINRQPAMKTSEARDMQRERIEGYLQKMTF